LYTVFHEDSKTAIRSFEAHPEPELFKFEFESCGQTVYIGTLS